MEAQEWWTITHFLTIVLCIIPPLVGNEEELERFQRIMQDEQNRWTIQESFRNITEEVTMFLQLLEITAFADLPPEAEVAVQELMVPRIHPRLLGGAGKRSDWMVDPRGRIDVFRLMRDKVLARSTIARRLFDTLHRQRRTVIQRKLGPDIVALAAARKLHQRGQTVQGRRVRKAYHCLTDEERYRYHNVVNSLKRTPVGNSSAYDVFAIINNYFVSPGAYFGPSFLPWHRHYLWLYETALRQIDDSVVLPYWDNTQENKLRQPLCSEMWDDNHLGKSNGEVTSGPFAHWVTHMGDVLKRNVTGDKELLYKEDLISSLLQPSNFTDFWETFEAAHHLPRYYVGGHMQHLATAAADPLLFMHYAFLDCLWEEWRATNQHHLLDRSTDYPSDNEVAPPHQNDQPMTPFSVRNSYGLRHVYTTFYYTCQPRHACPPQDSD